MTAPLSGVVLAGGSSRRMGTDKAVLRWHGRRLVDRAVDCLSAVADDVVVAAGARQLDGLAVPQVADRPPEIGPLGGIAAGLAAGAGDLVCVLAVDLPYADPVLFASLAAIWQGEAAVIPSWRGRPQPLHAVWSAAAGPALGVLVQEGVRSVSDATAGLGATVVDEATTGSFARHDRWGINLNHPADIGTATDPRAAQGGGINGNGRRRGPRRPSR